MFSNFSFEKRVLIEALSDEELLGYLNIDQYSDELYMMLEG
jgi:hypothetical protein